MPNPDERAPMAAEMQDLINRLPVMPPEHLLGKPTNLVHRTMLDQVVEERNFLRARIAELEAQSEELARIADEHVNTAHRYRDALERLARLGNEPCYGNSIGNRIAQDALGIEVGLNA